MKITIKKKFDYKKLINWKNIPLIVYLDDKKRKKNQRKISTKPIEKN